MKKFNLLLSAVVLFLAGNSFVDAQNSKNPWAITVGAHAVDHNSATGPFNQYFKTENWDIVPPLSKLSIIRNLNRSFDVDLTASVGEVDNNRLAIKDELFINAGLGLRYKLANGYILGEDSWFDPYVRVGANYHRYDYTGLAFPLTAYHGNENGGTYQLTEVEDLEKNHFTVSAGVGFNLWFTKNFGLNVASDYNWLPAYGGNNYFDFFQHSVGVTFRFGKQDRDNDGIADDEDACPDTPGIATGDPATNGCPDTDGDGIFDKDDACPEVPGLAEFQGCPDTDGDGIADKDDACPTVKGPKENNGCPWTEVEVSKRLSNILFEYNSDKIVPSSYDDVRIAAQILNSDDLKANAYYIDGHADQRGSDAYNKKLSLKRAQALVNILSERGGVDKSRLTARGLGEANLLCTEETEECYQKNRRVEVLPKNATVVETKVVKPAKKK